MFRRSEVALYQVRRPKQHHNVKPFLLEKGYVPRPERIWHQQRKQPHGLFGFKSLQQAWDPEKSRPSFWASDFRHRYRVKTGNEYTGNVPSSPAPGTYQHFTDKQVDTWLGERYRPPRDSRALPVKQLTARAVSEDFEEAKAQFSYDQSNAKQRIKELQDTEFWEWYTKVQRVRGKWCRDNGISSRGVYGPAVDAAEMWS